jgi:type II secretory pathway component PulF
MSELAAIKGVMRTMLDPVIYAIYVDLENGHYFRDAIKKFPNVFDDVYVGIVEAFF